MSAVDMGLACRLAQISAFTYDIDDDGSVPYPGYQNVGFAAKPEAAVAGAEEINVALVGPTPDGVVLAFRGTLPLEFGEDLEAFAQSLLDWTNDAKAKLVPGIGGMVHRGFAAALDTLWPSLLPEVKSQLASAAPLLITGHSKGGAIASLAAIKLKTEEGIEPAGVYTFGSPHAGDTAFAKNYDREIKSQWRFENQDDIVPHLPPRAKLAKALAKLDDRLQRLAQYPYAAVGKLQFINWKNEIQSEGFFLEWRRLGHLAAMLAQLQFKEIGGDHSVAAAGNYQRVPCAQI